MDKLHTSLLSHDCMQKLCSYSHIDLPLDQVIEYAKMAEELNPIKEGYSLHVWSKIYEINGKTIEIGGDLSSGELFGYEIIKNNWSNLDR